MTYSLEILRIRMVLKPKKNSEFLNIMQNCSKTSTLELKTKTRTTGYFLTRIPEISYRETNKNNKPLIMRFQTN